jgi:hypothetical protein
MRLKFFPTQSVVTEPKVPYLQNKAALEALQEGLLSLPKLKDLFAVLDVDRPQYIKQIRRLSYDYIKNFVRLERLCSTIDLLLREFGERITITPEIIIEGNYCIDLLIDDKHLTITKPDLAMPDRAWCG